MFYDRESMVEMYESSLKKKQFHYFLITLEMMDDSIKTSEMFRLVPLWKESLKHALLEDDAAYEVNSGNVFAVVHEKNKSFFYQRCADGVVYDKHNKPGVRSFVSELTLAESQFLLSLG